MDSLTGGNPDTDGDGNPNLSNVIITYNHLLGDVNVAALDNTIECSLLAPFACEGDDAAAGSYLLPEYRTQPPYLVVRVGTPLGLTGADSDFDHLHLSMFFARGFNRASNSEKAFAFNPLLMYSSGLVAQHRFQSYFPYIAGQREPRLASDSLGIGATCSSGANPNYPYLNCELNRWSGGGGNFGNADAAGNRYNEYPANTFWEVQSLTPPPPNQVEWSTDYYPLRPSNSSPDIMTLLEYLAGRFTTVYQGPNCTLSLDDASGARQPYRQQAECNLADQDDDSPWIVSPHG